METEKFEYVLQMFEEHLAIEPSQRPMLLNYLSNIEALSFALIELRTMEERDSDFRYQVEDIALDVAVRLATPTGNPNCNVSGWRVHTSWLESYSSVDVLSVLVPNWSPELDRGVPPRTVQRRDFASWLEEEGTSLATVLHALSESDSAIRVVSMYFLVDVILSRLHFGLTKCRVFVR